MVFEKTSNSTLTTLSFTAISEDRGDINYVNCIATIYNDRVYCQFLDQNGKRLTHRQFSDSLPIRDEKFSSSTPSILIGTNWNGCWFWLRHQRVCCCVLEAEIFSPKPPKCFLLEPSKFRDSTTTYPHTYTWIELLCKTLNPRLINTWKQCRFDQHFILTTRLQRDKRK